LKRNSSVTPKKKSIRNEKTVWQSSFQKRSWFENLGNATKNKRRNQKLQENSPKNWENSPIKL
jgi:hypothetical protein